MKAPSPWAQATLRQAHKFQRPAPPCSVLCLELWGTNAITKAPHLLVQGTFQPVLLSSPVFPMPGTFLTVLYAHLFWASSQRGLGIVVTMETLFHSALVARRAGRLHWKADALLELQMRSKFLKIHLKLPILVDKMNKNQPMLSPPCLLHSPSLQQFQLVRPRFKIPEPPSDLASLSLLSGQR